MKKKRFYWLMILGFLLITLSACRNQYNLKFSHGICPKCAHSLYPEIIIKLNSQKLFKMYVRAVVVGQIFVTSRFTVDQAC